MLRNPRAPAAFLPGDGAGFVVVNPSIRTAEPADYDVVAPLIDSCWARPVLGSLSRPFLDPFHRTSLVNLTPAGFHQSMGHAVTGPVAGYNGPGPGHDMLVLERSL